MKSHNSVFRVRRTIFPAVGCALVVLAGSAYGQNPSVEPGPLAASQHPVDWWFVFKFNAKSFPGCAGGVTRTCTFGGTVQPYKEFSQQFVYATSDAPALQKGAGCAGESVSDPIGATFERIYRSDPAPYYVVWNDQFYGAPTIPGCSSGNCPSPWGHSKGVLAWGESGDGVVMQVSTPSWPGAASTSHPRSEASGNTLGCVADNDVLVSQHFFALRLTKDDVVSVIAALENASVATDVTNLQIVRNGGPGNIQDQVRRLGHKSDSTTPIVSPLSTGVVLISKPSNLNVPPWQMVSAVLQKTPLRAATWWASPRIPTTTPSTKIDCWDSALGKPATVEIATSGKWENTPFGLKGGPGPDFNHSKIGVSLAGNRHYVIFGDLNQQGTIAGPKCSSSQNGRGGLFFVIDDEQLHESVSNLIAGETAPTSLP